MQSEILIYSECPSHLCLIYILFIIKSKTSAMNNDFKGIRYFGHISLLCQITHVYIIHMSTFKFLISPVNCKLMNDTLDIYIKSEWPVIPDSLGQKFLFHTQSFEEKSHGSSLQADDFHFIDKFVPHIPKPHGCMDEAHYKNKFSGLSYYYRHG